MPSVSMRQLLEAGVHFGHQTRRWNPKMKPFIFAERNGIHIIDLAQTVQRLDVALEFVRETVARGDQVLFVGTKKQAQEPVAQEATRANQPYVNKRWLGGMLTNFVTIKKRIGLLEQLEARQANGDFERMTKKEAAKLTEEMVKLQGTLGGMRKMKRLPGAIFIVDPHRERIAVTEANKLEIPVVGTGDTNVDPDELDYIIPANDDAIRAIRLLCTLVADAAIEGARERSARSRPSPSQVEAMAMPEAEDEEVPARPTSSSPPSPAARRSRSSPTPTRTTCCPATASPAPRRPSPSPRPRPRPRRSPPSWPAKRPRRTTTSRGRPASGELSRRRRTRPARSRSTPQAGDATRGRRETGERTGMADISAELVKELRERTGAGFMDCKRALIEADGDLDKATVVLREKGLAAAAKKAGRDAREGLVSSYIHTGGRVGVLIEVNCETDFVARTDEFQKLVRDLAVQVAGLAPLYVDADAHPGRRARGEAGRAARRRGDPEEAREHPRRRSSTASSRSGTRRSACYDQPFRDEERTVRDLITEQIATIGENIRVRRFTRYALGEEL